MAVLAVLFALLAAAPAAFAFIPAGTPSYTDIAPYSYWKITIDKRSSPSEEWQPHVCPAADFGVACNQPPLEEHTTSQIRVTWTPRNASKPFAAWREGTPVDFVVRLDYHPVSAVDRGWRKKNGAYPQFGQHGKWIIAIDPFSAAGGVAYWDLAKADEVTDAVLYPEVCTRCNYPDGKQEWCQCDRTNAGANLNTIETRVEGSITPAMRGVAIAFSIFAPLILIVYTVVDRWYYNKYGKTFQIARVHVH